MVTDLLAESECQATCQRVRFLLKSVILGVVRLELRMHDNMRNNNVTMTMSRYSCLVVLQPFN